MDLGDEGDHLSLFLRQRPRVVDQDRDFGRHVGQGERTDLPAAGDEPERLQQRVQVDETVEHDAVKGADGQLAAGRMRTLRYESCQGDHRLDHLDRRPPRLWLGAWAVGRFGRDQALHPPIVEGRFDPGQGRRFGLGQMARDHRRMGHRARRARLDLDITEQPGHIGVGPAAPFLVAVDVGDVHRS